MSIRVHYTILTYFDNKSKAEYSFRGFYNNVGEAIQSVLSALGTKEQKRLTRLDIKTEPFRV